MEGSIEDFSKYRLENAKEDLERAKTAKNAEDFKLVMNRSYYAIFHAIRAVNALDGFDSSKHKGVISHFNKEHVKTEDFPRIISKMISNAMDCRQKSEYEDFYIISKNEAIEQLDNAEFIIGLVEKYLENKFAGDRPTA